MVGSMKNIPASEPADELSVQAKSVTRYDFVRKLRSCFGDRFLRYLVLTYFGLKGIVYALLQTAMLPFFQHMGVTGTNFQLASVVAMIPWSMKGWIGVLSDILPLGRFHKRGYLLLSSVLGVFGIAGLAGIPTSALDESMVWTVALLFAAAFTFLATFDLLCEGKYSEIMREEPTAGSEVLSLVWMCIQMGSLIAAVSVGFVIDADGPRPLIAACLPFALLAAWRTAAGDLPEEPARSWASLRLKAYSEPELFLLATAMAAGSLAVALAAAVFGAEGRAVVALGVSGCLILYSFRTLPSTLARSNLYMFIVSVAYLDLSGPLAYFYTGGTGCVPGGPHFSYGYYLAVSNVVGSAGAMIGAAAFQAIGDWSFRGAFYITAFIQIFASLFDLLIINRWNIALGFSDQATYLFGDAACQSMAAQMVTMPMALLTARLCPRGAEATVFAILAGFQNFGSSVGSILGAQLAGAFGIESSKDGPCNFEWLGFLIVLCHMVIPVACLPLTWCLVPDARMDDEEAFALVSPPPSFCSPASSPAASPRLSPEDDPSFADVDAEYCLMHDDGGETAKRQISG